MHSENLDTYQDQKLKRELGLFATAAIGMGQMIGSGIYMTPQGLAELANPKAAILAIIITGIGTILLSLCFAGLGEAMPITGSAVVYTKYAFGELPSFLVGWSYWCGCWIGNGAIVLGGISYASYFFPSLAESGLQRFLIAATIIWLYTFINIRGVKGAGYVNLVLTVVKLLPLIVFIAIAALNFNPENLATSSAPEVEGLSVLPIAIAYALWSFTGFEASSVNAGEVKDKRIIKPATIIGTGLVVIIYLIIVTLAAGNMPQDQLAASSSPLSDIIYNATGGYWAGGFISMGVCISAFGCIGAWIISSARIAFAMGEQCAFPKIFAHVHPKYKTPDKALIINGVLMTLILLLSIAAPQGTIYNTFVLLAVMSLLVFYAFGAASHVMLMAKKQVPFHLITFIKNGILGLSAFAYAVYTIYGSGETVVMYGFLLLLFGLPFYIYIKMQNDGEKELREKAGLGK